MKIIQSMFYSGLEVLTIAPLFLWFNHLFFDQAVTSVEMLGLFIIYMSTAALGHLFTGYWTRLPIGASIAYLSTTLIELPSTWQAVLFGVVIFVMSIRGFYYSRVELETVFSDAMMWIIAVPSYFISYFLFQDTPYISFLTLGAIILMIALLFITNKSHLRAASSKDEAGGSLPRHIKRQNQWYLVILLVMIIIMTRFNFIAAGLIHAFRFLFGLLNQESDIPEESMQEDQTYQPPMPEVEVAEPHPLIELFEQMLAIVAYGALFIAMMFFLYLLIRQIPKVGPLIQRFLKRMLAVLFFHRKRQQDISETAYIDEKASVFTFKNPFQPFKHRVNQTFRRKVKWQTLDNRMKVRYLFQAFITHQEKVNDPFCKGETARDFINRLNPEIITIDNWRTQFIELYERARYSKEDIATIDALIESYKRNH